jgi:hypothetical protein
VAAQDAADDLLDVADRGGLTPSRRAVIRVLAVYLLAVAILLAGLLPCTTCRMELVERLAEPPRRWVEAQADRLVSNLFERDPPPPLPLGPERPTLLRSDAPRPRSRHDRVRGVR